MNNFVSLIKKDKKISPTVQCNWGRLYLLNFRLFKVLY